MLSYEMSIGQTVIIKEYDEWWYQVPISYLTLVKDTPYRIAQKKKEREELRKMGLAVDDSLDAVEIDPKKASTIVVLTRDKVEEIVREHVQRTIPEANILNIQFLMDFNEFVVIDLE